MKFCDCGSMIIDEKCSNKKCGKIHATQTQFELKLQYLLDEVNKIDDSRLKSFDGALPMNIGGIELHEINESNKYGLLSPIEFKRKIPSLHQVGIGNVNITNKIFFSKIRWTNIKETRGLIKKIYPIMITQEVFYPYSKDPYWKMFWGFAPNGNANFLNTDTVIYDPTAEDLLYKATEAAIICNSSWNVYLKESTDKIGIKVMVQPTSLKQLFKLRDLPPGKERRSALLNWVFQHYRHKPNKTTDDDLIEVSQYLRGSTEFNWNGLYCKIYPSVEDLICLERLRERRL